MIVNLIFTLINLVMIVFIWPSPAACFSAFAAGVCAFAAIVAFREGY